MSQQDRHEFQIRIVPPGTEGAVPLDELVSRYPEALQTRPTWPCPLCQTEIAVPQGHIRAYAAHLKASDKNFHSKALVQIAIRNGCRLS